MSGPSTPDLVIFDDPAPRRLTWRQRRRHRRVIRRWARGRNLHGWWHRNRDGSRTYVGVTDG